MASGWNLWVCLQCIGVASRCCYKEVYRYHRLRCGNRRLGLVRGLLRRSTHTGWIRSPTITSWPTSSCPVSWATASLRSRAGPSGGFLRDTSAHSTVLQVDIYSLEPLVASWTKAAIVLRCRPSLLLQNFTR